MSVSDPSRINMSTTRFLTIICIAVFFGAISATVGSIHGKYCAESIITQTPALTDPVKAFEPSNLDPPTPPETLLRFPSCERLRIYAAETKLGAYPPQASDPTSTWDLYCSGLIIRYSK